MNALFDAYSIATCVWLAGIVVVVFVAGLTPKEQRGKILRRRALVSRVLSAIA